MQKYFLHFLIVSEKEPEYYVNCNSIVGLEEDFCKGLTDAELGNEAGGGVLAEFSEEEVITTSTNCTLGGMGEGLLAGHGLITDPESGLALSVSE
jgi:hypothetical protein